jgi:hypothetical protein
MLPVEGLAKIADQASNLFEGNIRSELWALTNVLIVVNVHNRHSVARSALNIYGSISPYFAGEGLLPYPGRGDWRQEYWDETPNQAYHFWGFVAMSYYDGLAVAHLGNIIHDPYFLEEECGDDLADLRDHPILGSWPNFAAETSKEDWDLSLEAIRLGQELRFKVPFYEGILRFFMKIDLGTEIRTRLKE